MECDCFADSEAGVGEQFKEEPPFGRDGVEQAEQFGFGQRFPRWLRVRGGLGLGEAEAAARGRSRARRAVVRSAWLRVVDGSADAVGEWVAGVFVEPAGL